MKTGVYNLILFLGRAKTIRIGALGRFCFPKGYYVYTGSALGGLDARIARHCRQDKIKHWHIDYLRPHCRLVGINIYQTDKKAECLLNRHVLSLKGAQIVAPKFGASDCRCESHLAYFSDINYENLCHKLHEFSVFIRINNHDDMEERQNSL